MFVSTFNNVGENLQAWDWKIGENFSNVANFKHKIRISFWEENIVRKNGLSFSISSYPYQMWHVSEVRVFIQNVTDIVMRSRLKFGNKVFKFLI